eukprot:scaffold18271_cov111-Skeletonema_dohrnii-CCMP3373.AAC.1
MTLKLTLAYCTIIIALPLTFNFTIVIYTHCTPSSRKEKKQGGGGLGGKGTWNDLDDGSLDD